MSNVADRNMFLMPIRPSKIFQKATFEKNHDTGRRPSRFNLVMGRSERQVSHFKIQFRSFD